MVPIMYYYWATVTYISWGGMIPLLFETQEAQWAAVTAGSVVYIWVLHAGMTAFAG